ncbi:hypothetical protein YC2023_036232 [Brassica napus]
MKEQKVGRDWRHQWWLRRSGHRRITEGELPSVTQNLESNPKQYPNLGQRQK